MTLTLLSGILVISGKERISESESEYKEILKEGREWVFEYHSEDVSFNRYDIEHTPVAMDLVRIVGDTVVHGKTCKILEVKYIGWKEIVYEENQELRLLYDLDDFKSFEENSCCIFSQYRRPSPDIFHDIITDLIYVDDKKTRRRYTENHYGYLFFVDGIGVSSGMCVERIPGTPVPKGADTTWYLVQVRDDGKVTFDRSDFYQDIENKPFSEIRMVREDRVWVYGGRNADGSFYKSYCRFGPAVRFGVWDYNPFTEFRRETWQDPARLGDYTVTDGGVIPDALIREQCGTVYMANPEKENEEYCLYMFNTLHMLSYRDWVVPPDVPTSEGELYIPDMTFSTDYGDFLEFVFYVPEFWPIFGEMEIDGEKRLTYYYHMNGRDEPVVVEGIGITSMGTLPYNFHPDHIPEEGCPRLLEYRDADGKVIHKFADFSEVTGISGVAETEGDLSEDQRMFDLFGREIRDPQPGTVYVRGGRKFVAR